MKIETFSDSKLHQTTKKFAAEIIRETLKMLELLSEIDARKSYVDLGYNSLFTYIERDLGFSAAQAALYNSIIKSELTKIPEVIEMVKSEQLPLYVLGYAGNQIRSSKKNYHTNEQKISLLKEMKGKSREVLRNEYGSIKKQEITSPAKVVIERKVWKDLQKVKRKIGTPWMTDAQVIALLVNKELNSEKEVYLNQTITNRTRQIILRKAEHRCEFHSHKGRRCPATTALEVDHIIPRAKGGSNHPSNLRILCKTHNLRGAFFEFGRTPV